MRQLSLDIEAMPTTEPPQFENEQTWLPFAVALSFRRAPDAMPETAVFVRDSPTAHAERKMLAAAANWIHDRRPVDTLLTFNGGDLRPDADGFDLPILSYRIEELLEGYDDALAAYVHSALGIPHRDLFAEIVDNQPEQKKWPSLAEALGEHDLAKATPELDGEAITGGSMPAFGARIMDGDGLSQAQRRVLTEYASSDVRPLHPLADGLDRERRADAEADAVTGGQR